VGYSAWVGRLERAAYAGLALRRARPAGRLAFWQSAPVAETERESIIPTLRRGFPVDGCP
jgi:hypothetical protein